MNKRVALIPELRQNIRAQVFAIEQRIAKGERGLDINKLLLSAASRVGRLNSYHASEGGHLKLRLKALRQILELEILATSVASPAAISEIRGDLPPPWE